MLGMLCYFVLEWLFLAVYYNQQINREYNNILWIYKWHFLVMY